MAEYSNLGRCGVKVSPLCLGTMMFGGPTPEEESVRIIHRALDAGINFLDTANVYNGGESERIIGKALRGRRDAVVQLIRIGWEARIADPTEKPQLDKDIESLVTYMLFADEASLHGQVRGVSTFTKTFPERGRPVGSGPKRLSTPCRSDPQSGFHGFKRGQF